MYQNDFFSKRRIDSESLNEPAKVLDWCSQMNERLVDYKCTFANKCVCRNIEAIKNIQKDTRESVVTAVGESGAILHCFQQNRQSKREKTSITVNE